MVRHRAKLVTVRSALKTQVNAVLAKEGVMLPVTKLFSVTGRSLLESVELGDAYRLRVDSLLRLVDAFGPEIETFDHLVSDVLRHHPGYQAIQAIPGVGPVLGGVFVAEIGDASRFPGPSQLCSWAGLTPAITSRIPKYEEGIFPSRAVAWSVGRPWRPSATSTAPRRSERCITASLTGGAKTSVGSRPPEHFSLSSITAYATAISVAWPTLGETRARPAGEPLSVMTPAPSAWSPV